MQGWRGKARKLEQTQVFLAHIYHSHNGRPCANTLQELYDKLKHRILISQVQHATADQADLALYMTSHPPSDSQHFQGTLSKSSGNFPQQIRSSPDPEYIIPGTRIGNIHCLNRAHHGRRAIYSFQRPVWRPDNWVCMLTVDVCSFNLIPLTFPLNLHYVRFHSRPLLSPPTVTANI